MIVSKCEINVRYYETDLMGIVHHSNYIRYFEYGRHMLLEDFGIPTQDIERDGIMMPVVSVDCRYLLPARMGDKLTIVTTIDKMPMAKIVANAEIYNQKGELLCTGKVIVGFIHSDTRKPTRMPQKMVDVFEKYFK